MKNKEVANLVGWVALVTTEFQNVLLGYPEALIYVPLITAVIAFSIAIITED